MGIDGNSPLPEEITTMVARKARQIARRCRCASADQEELEQQITLAILRKRAAVSESRARQMGFLISLVQHAVADIIAARRAGNRDYRREESPLDEWVLDDAGNVVRRGDTITEEDARRRVGGPGTPREDLVDLAIDLSVVTASLPPYLREVCGHLVETGSVRATARKMGVHHSNVYKAIRQIEQRLETAGLKDYLPATPFSPRQIFGPAGW